MHTLELVRLQTHAQVRLYICIYWLYVLFFRGQEGLKRAQTWGPEMERQHSLNKLELPCMAVRRVDTGFLGLFGLQPRGENKSPRLRERPCLKGKAMK